MPGRWPWRGRDGHPMLKLRRIAIDTHHENVAFLRRDCSLCRAESFQASGKGDF